MDELSSQHREKIRERSIRGRRLAAQQGNVIIHGRPPFGYRYVREGGHGRLEIDPSTAPIVRWIFALYVKGLSAREIVNRMRGIPTPQDLREYPGLRGKKRPYGHWSASTVIRIVANETYAGRFYYGGTYAEGSEPVVVQVPAIVDEDIWEAAVARREKNRKMVASRRTRYKYLVGGMSTCSCGLAIGAHPVIRKLTSGKRVHLYYRCPSSQKSKYVDRGCELPFYRADRVDPVVWREVRGYLLEPDRLDREYARYQQQRETVDEAVKEHLATVQRLIKEHQAKLSRLLDLYLAGDFDRDVLAERKQRLEKVIGDLAERKAELEEQLAQTITPQQLEVAREWAALVADGLAEAEERFELRRAVLEELGTRVTFFVEEGKRMVEIVCHFGPISVSPVDTSSRMHMTQTEK